MNGGGGGSRTRVLRSFHAGFYKFSRKLYVFSGGFGIRPSHSGTPPEFSLKWVNSLQEIDSLIIGIENADQIKSHFQTIEKDVTSNIFDEALKINYSNIKVTNPSMWK